MKLPWKTRDGQTVRYLDFKDGEVKTAGQWAKLLQMTLPEFNAVRRSNKDWWETVEK